MKRKMDHETECRITEAERAIDKISAEGVHTIIVGHDGPFMMSIHTQPLSDGPRTHDTEWARVEAQRINLDGFLTNVHAIAAVARRRLPGVIVYNCRCTCCSNGLDEIADADLDKYAEAA